MRAFRFFFPFLAAAAAVLFQFGPTNAFAQSLELRSVAVAASGARPWLAGLATEEGPALLEVSAVGTGETTGEIGLLTFTNLHEADSSPVTITFGPLFIPSDGKHQSYVVPEQQQVEVPAGQTVTVPLYGYCADITRPPVPDGEAITGIEDWLELDEAGFAGWRPDPSAGWEPVDEIMPGDHEVLIPGSDQPLGHTIDLDRYPREAAPVVLAGLLEIVNAYDELESEGAIETPMSGRPDQQRDSVIQQTFWIYAAALTGTAYKLEDFRTRTIEQFEEATGSDFDDAPEETREQIDAGVSDFWNTFNAVGAEAKVIRVKDEDERPIQAATDASADNTLDLFQMQRDRPRDDRPRCRCNQLSFRVTVTDGERQFSASASFEDDNPHRSADMRIKDPIEIRRPRNESDLKVTVDNFECDCSCEVDMADVDTDDESGDEDGADADDSAGNGNGEAESNGDESGADEDDETQIQPCDTLFPDRTSAVAGENAGQIGITTTARMKARSHWTVEEAEGDSDSDSQSDTSSRTTYKLTNTHRRPDDEARSPFELQLTVKLKFFCGGNELCQLSSSCGRKYQITIKEQ